MESIFHVSSDEVLCNAKEIIGVALGKSSDIYKQFDNTVFVEDIKCRLEQLDRKRIRVDACNLLIENHGHPYESWVMFLNIREIEILRNRLVQTAKNGDEIEIKMRSKEIYERCEQVKEGVFESTLIYSIVFICMHGWGLNEVSTNVAIGYIVKILEYIRENKQNLYNRINKLLLLSEFPFREKAKYGRYYLEFPTSDSFCFAETEFLRQQERKKAIYLMLFWELHGTMRLRYARECERIRSTEFFRYLQYKAQVMFNCASDEQRTRLSHSLEVSGTAKTIAKQIGCNWELAEAIALGHDVGHVAFGHQGEEMLDECLHQAWAGRFIHSLQSVKVLNDLTKHSVIDGKFGISGLCLSRPVLEGVLKHDSDCLFQDITRASWRLQYNRWQETLVQYMDSEDKLQVIMDEGQTGICIGNLESQIVYWADKISYAGHDWEELANSEIIDEITMEISDILKRMHQLRHLAGGRTGFTRTIIKREDIKSEEQLIKYIRYRLEELRNSFVLPETYFYNHNNDYKNVLEEKEDAMIKGMKKRFVALKPGDESLLSTIVSDLEFVLENGVLNSLKYFTEREYRLLLDFFSVIENWITITGIYPKPYKKSDDFLWIFNHYLKEIDNRIIVRSLGRDIIRNTLHRLKKNSINSETDVRRFGAKALAVDVDGKTMQSIRDEISRVGYILNPSLEIRQKNKNLKRQFKRALHQNMLVSLSIKVLEAFEKVDEFKMKYYIGSARVRAMKVKAHKIIREIFDFFMKHPDMLPVEYQQTIELNALILSNTPASTECSQFDCIVYEYLYERLLEFDKQNNNAISKKLNLENISDIGALIEKMHEVKTSKKSEKLRWVWNWNESIDEFIGEGTIEDSNYASKRLALCKHIAKARVIADYIASMTDRMAEKKYNEIVSSSTAWSTSYRG